MFLFANYRYNTFYNSLAEIVPTDRRVHSILQLPGRTRERKSESR